MGCLTFRVQACTAGVSLSVTLSRELDAGPMGFGFAARSDIRRGSGWSSVLSQVPGRRAVGFASGAEALHALRQRSFQPQVRSQASGSLLSTKWRTHGYSTSSGVAPGCHGASVALEVQMPERVLFTLRLWIGQVSLTGRHAAPRTSPANIRTVS